MSDEKYKVLLVDDSPDDRFFMKVILERSSKFKIEAEARDGQEAIDYLKGEGNFKDRPPVTSLDLILLDLKMTGKNGFDVLEWMKREGFGDLTVGIMSGSWLPDDITKSVELGADGYFKKTSEKEEQKQMISDMEKLIQERRKF